MTAKVSSGKLNNSDSLMTFPAALECFQKGKAEDAEKLCNTLLRDAPEHSDALLLLAMISIKTGRDALADDYFNKSLAAAPGNIGHYIKYTSFLASLGFFEKAKEYCARAIQIDDNNFEVCHLMGSILFKTHHYREALEFYHKSLTIRPNDVYTLNNLGSVFCKLNRYTEAISSYQNALRLKDDFTEAANNLGQLFMAMGEPYRAEKCFAQVLKYRPDHPQAAKNLQDIKSIWLVPIKGKRVILRRCNEGDANFIHQCLSDRNFVYLYNQNLPRNATIETLARNLHAENARHPLQTRSISWIILKQVTGQPLGIANLADIDVLHRRAEFLIGLPKNIQKSAQISIECSLLVYDFVFNRVALNKLTCQVYGHNIHAQNSALSIGFIQEGYLREHIVNPNEPGFLDVYLNGIIEKDFRANKRLAKVSTSLLGLDITPPGSAANHQLP